MTQRLRSPAASFVGSRQAQVRSACVRGYTRSTTRRERFNYESLHARPANDRVCRDPARDHGGHGGRATDVCRLRRPRYQSLHTSIALPFLRPRYRRKPTRPWRGRWSCSILPGTAPFTITKAISIIAPPGVYAGLSPTAGQDGVTVTAGVSDKVVLRGLTINGQGGIKGSHGQLGRSGAHRAVHRVEQSPMVSASTAADIFIFDPASFAALAVLAFSLVQGRQYLMSAIRSLSGTGTVEFPCWPGVWLPRASS